MKHVCLLLFTLIVAAPLFATEQAPERLFLNGKEYGMQYLPLYDLDTLLQRQIENGSRAIPRFVLSQQLCGAGMSVIGAFRMTTFISTAFKSAPVLPITMKISTVIMATKT